MKIGEALQVIDAKWVEKQQGFRVQFRRFDGTEWLDDLSPPEDAALLDSDVTAWRLAWKLAESTPLRSDQPQAGDMVDIRVVNHQGESVEYYATGEMTVFNQAVAGDL
jgi:hypothetical protein